MKATARDSQTLWRIFSKVCQDLGEDFPKAQLVTIEPVKATRSLQQNKYLWGVVYKTILEDGGLGDQGWRNEDLHEYYLGECYGWQKLEGLDRPRMRPLRGSSKMSKTEFADYIMFIQQKAAEIGIVIPDPMEDV